MSALTGKGLVTAGGFDPNTVGASAIFDGSADYLSKTFGSDGDLTEWTLSAWVQRTAFGVRHTIYGDNGGTNQDDLRFESDDSLRFIQVRTSLVTDVRTSAVFRDVGWYHVVISYDSDNATAADRLKMYVNGEEITDFQTSDTVDSARASTINSTETNYVGAVGAASLMNGYFAQVALIDGQSIQNSDFTIDDFGQTFTAGTNGTIWSPKPDASIAALAAAAGGNSFCLTDGIAAGTDASGNGNDFTPSGSPTASENTPSKVYAILNPLNASSSVTLADGSLNATSSSGATGNVTSTLAVPSTGKYQFEMLYTSGGTSGAGVVMGIYALNEPPTTRVGNTAGNYVAYAMNGALYDSTSATTGLTAPAAGSIITMTYDADTGDMEWFDDGVSIYTYTASAYAGQSVYFFVGDRATTGAANDVTANFGDGGLTHPQTGFNTLNSANITAPDYQGADWFSATAYSGDGGARSFTGRGFQPDLVWIKDRNSGVGHLLFDAVRGTGNALFSHVSNAEAATPAQGYLNSFDADGWSGVDGSSGDNNYNEATYTYVDWDWRGDGTSGSSNTDGSITSTVNVAAPGHFSIISYTGNATGGATVGHGLSAAPEMVIGKNRDNASGWWRVAHKDIGTQNLALQRTDAATNPGEDHIGALGATTITLDGGASYIHVNGSGENIIMYAFRSVPGVCKVGSYTGNGSTDGPYVYLGFKPRWILFKVSSSINDWVIYDTARDTYNVSGQVLRADTAAAEFDGRTGNSRELDILSDGFKPRTSNAVINANAATYIYLAMADVAGNGILPPIPGR